MTIQIYVACLASYNNGHLHGEWIDVTQGYDSVMDDIQDMLENSPIPDAEEWAIHDHAGFEGATIGQYDDIEEVCRLAELIEEHGEPFVLFYNDSRDLDSAEEHFEEAYQGEWDSEEEFTMNLIEETTDLTDIPDFIRHHIDWEGVAQDLFIDDYWSEEMSDGSIVVCSRHH